MAARRVFYVTQDAMIVWQHGPAGMRQEVTFQSGDDGFKQFDDYLQKTAQRASVVLVDVIEEEFATDSIPKLSWRDRKALIQRRLKRRFSRTPYRLGIYQGRESRNASDYDILHSAVSNHELLDPWLHVIARNKTPVSGIHSVPHMTADLVSRLHSIAGNALVLSQHQGYKLRQVFLRSGKLKSARLSQSPAVTDESYGEFIGTEITRSRRYLERTRLLSALEELDVYIIADEQIAERIIRGSEQSIPMRIHFINPTIAARKIGGVGAVPNDRQEVLYVSQCCRKTPKVDYAQHGETRFHLLIKARHLLIGTAVTISVLLSLATGYLLSDAWLKAEQIASIELQLEQLSETFRRENESFQPIQADSHEMKVAVDTGDYILQNRLPVPWVLQQLGTVLGDFPDMQVTELGWRVESPPSESAANQRRGDRQAPVSVAQINAVSAELSGRIDPHDGDLRDAFARIDELAAELAARTGFSRVVAIEYPLDARPQALLNGEIARKGLRNEAGFKLRLTLTLPHANEIVEAIDESA